LANLRPNKLSHPCSGVQLLHFLLERDAHNVDLPRCMVPGFFSKHKNWKTHLLIRLPPQSHSSQAQRASSFRTLSTSMSALGKRSLKKGCTHEHTHTHIHTYTHTHTHTNTHPRTHGTPGGSGRDIRLTTRYVCAVRARVCYI
jgi:hypothetical protein